MNWQQPLVMPDLSEAAFENICFIKICQYASLKSTKMEAKKVISHFFLSLRRLICINLQYSDELNFIVIFLLTLLSISGEFVEVFFQNLTSYLSVDIEDSSLYFGMFLALSPSLHHLYWCSGFGCLCVSGWSQSPGPHYCSQPSCQWSSGSQADTQLVPGLSTEAGKLSIHCSGSTTEHECCQKICHPFIASVQTAGK